jgi:hypothetical protein
MIETFIYIIILALTAYELTNLLVHQEGPFRIFERIREFFGLYEMEEEIVLDESRFAIFGHNLVGNILSCPYCTKVWMVGFVWLLSLPFVTVPFMILAPFAAAGLITIILDFVG